MVFPTIWRRVIVSLALVTIFCAAGLLALRTDSAAAATFGIPTPFAPTPFAPTPFAPMPFAPMPFAPMPQDHSPAARVAALPSISMPQDHSPAAPDAPAAPGELVLAVPPHLDRTILDALAQRSGGRILRWAPRLGLALLSAPVGREQQVAQALEIEPLVRFVTENRLLARAADIPLDEYWSSQWGMVQVQGPAAWDVTWADPSIVIAVIDTGVHLQHWDLRDQIWINPGESALDPATGKLTCDTPLAWNMVDDDGNGYVDDCLGYDFVAPDDDPMDENGHGTFVAGIASAATNNLNPVLGTPEGVAGMGRQARLMALRVLNANGRGYAFDIALAIDYATAEGAQVINLSLTFPPTTPPGSFDVEILRLAIEAAQAADVVVVAASGNDNYNGISYPAKFPGVLAVGASRRDDSRASFSNYGERLDLLAPGVEIISTLLRPGTHNYGYYGGSPSSSSGTSFASPHVAGVAALVRSLRPDLPQSVLYELIRRTADDVGDPGFDNQTGWGRLNAQRAVSEAIIGLELNLASDPPTLAVGTQSTVRLAITSPGGAPAGLGARVSLESSPGLGGVAAAGGDSLIVPAVVMADSRGRATALFTADVFTGTAYITATLGHITATLPVTITSGRPAALTLRAEPAVIASEGGQATVTAFVRDEGGSAVLDGTPVAFSATLGVIEPITATTVAGRAAAVFTAGAFAGTAMIQAEAGGYIATIPVSILGAGEPYTVTLTAEPPQIQLDGAPTVITAAVTDALGVPVPDGITVTFTSDLGIFSQVESLTAGGRAVTQLSPGLTPGVAHIVATSGQAVGHLEVRIQPGPPQSLTLRASPTELTAGFNQIASLEVTVTDRYGNPVADGTTVQFTTSLGRLLAASVPTSGGVAVTQLLGETVAGTALITAAAPGSVQASTQVRIHPSQPATVVVAIAPEQIAVGGEVAIVRATVRDTFDNLVADGWPVTFTTSLGALRAVGVTQVSTGTLFSTVTSNGVAEAALVSGEVAGTAEVRVAINASVPQVLPVRIVPGPPAQLSIGADPDRALGGHRVELSAWVLDRYQNSVADGTVVSFAANRGQLDHVIVQTRDGVALNWLTLPGEPGVVTVAAFSHPISNFMTVMVLRGTYLPLIVR